MNNIFVAGQGTGLGPIGALVDTFDDQLLEVSRQAVDEISMINNEQETFEIELKHLQAP
jgi:hypothetical protein